MNYELQQFEASISEMYRHANCVGYDNKGTSHRPMYDILKKNMRFSRA